MKKVCMYISKNQITKSNTDVWDFSKHAINNIELKWIMDRSQNHLLFLTALHAKQVVGPSEYDPLTLIPLDEAKRRTQVYTEEMVLLNVSRVARRLLIKNKFIGCDNGVSLVSYEGANFSSSDRRDTGK